MSPDEAMERANTVLAHAWMVPNFLKHAEEIEDHEEMLEVHRTIFDSIRAVEPSYQRRDTQEFLRRLRGKLRKLCRAAEYLAQEYPNVSSHTNFQMAAVSLSGCVQQLTEILESRCRIQESEGGVQRSGVRDRNP
jgi:hypothetical protein